MITEKNREFAKKLEKRTRLFASNIIRLSANLDKNLETDVVRRQLTKSGTSIGANYSEANRSRSSADFKNKIKICEGEANETLYWLSLIKDQEWNNGEELSILMKESNELIALFTSISVKLSQKKKRL